jgi:hypothetical protein
MDSMDIFVSLAKSPSAEVHSELTTFFTRIYNGEVHELIVPYLTSTYLFCLHKDLEDPTKLCPIGVPTPTAIQRILASHVAKAFRTTFARHLLPYNYAIGVPNCMDFVVKATQLQVDRFITQPQLRGTSPSRCLVSLNLKNMFNEISREKIFEIIAEHFPELLPLTSMLYNETGEVWLRMADGSWTTIDMVEGTNQGCPLSSTLAAIVLHSVIAPIADLLQQRAAARLAQGNPGDDGHGGVSVPMGYVDDKNVCLYIEDVHFFLSEFQSRAAPAGMFLNTNKTRILTSTNGTSAIPAIRQQYGPAIADSIQSAIVTFSTKPTPTPSDPTSTSPVEITTGLRVLGQPVGSKQFAKEFFESAISNIEHQVSKLFDSLSDKATILRLFSTCAMHKNPHLLGSEVLYTMDTVAPSSWDDWNGALAQRIHRMASYPS